MGEVLPGEFITNALTVDDCPEALSSSGFRHVQEELREMLTIEHTMEGGVAVVEPLIEQEEKTD